MGRKRRKGRKGRKRSSAFSVLSVLSALAGCGDELPAPPPGNQPPERPSLAQTYRPSGRMAAGDVFVHLFEWKWTDIAAECENVLGPAGVAAVQVSPPQEHSLEPPDYPWSQRYQPVSYRIERSRSGTDLEFVDMVERCRTAGVAIIVDAVINHMTNHPSPGVGSSGTAYSKYQYPGLYAPVDFHPPCVVSDYQDAANVQDCELLSLPDLHTGLASVRQKITLYLVSLARIGVAGFRIDAAKHIQQLELDDIVNRMNLRLETESWPLPYLFLEVIGGAGEALSPRDYFGVGYSSGGASDITEFTFVGVGDKFRGIGGQYLAQLSPDGPPGSRFSESAWGLMPSDKAVVFLQNHDTQHNCGLSYRDGDVFRLANVWMLAQPYGFPSILSSYAFSCLVQNFMGPPSDAGGNTSDVVCASSLESAEAGDWVCEHRDPYLLGMVAFRRVVAGTAITHWWDNGTNAIAFSRGERGFVALNRESAALDATVMTGLAPGTYCDRLTGGLILGTCAGVALVVEADGSVDLLLEPGSAVAIDVETAIVD